MKKIVISLLLLFTLSGAQAQIGTGFGVNMFLSADAGASMYSNRYNDNPVGFSGGISVGKWILTPLAFRVGFDFKTIPSTYQGLSYTSNFAFADAVFLWDFTSTFFRTRNWRINVYPMIGLGLAYRAAVTVGNKTFGTDHEFQTMLGLHVPVRIGNHWDIFAEYKCRFLPEAFDGSNGDVYLHSLTGVSPIPPSTATPSMSRVAPTRTGSLASASAPTSLPSHSPTSAKPTCTA